MSKNDKKFEFSKILTILVLLPYYLIIALGVLVVFKMVEADQYDPVVTLMAALFGAVAVPVGIVNGYYFWKSKAENLAKIAKDLKECGVDDGVTTEVINTEQINGGT